MNSQKILYNKVGNDESYTPAYGVEPIIKYLLEYEYNIYQKSFNDKDIMNLNKRNMIVWCPFDKSESEFVKQLKKCMCIDVVYSHIEDGKDFFEFEPKEWDIIISNPPFKNKRLFFERALSFGKPFALLMTNAWLNDKYSKWVFKEADREMQLLMFDKRIHFEQNGETKNKTTFSSSYYCCDFLPKQIILEELS